MEDAVNYNPNAVIPVIPPNPDIKKRSLGKIFGFAIIGAVVLTLIIIMFSHGNVQNFAADNNKDYPNQAKTSQLLAIQDDPKTDDVQIKNDIKEFVKPDGTSIQFNGQAIESNDFSIRTDKEEYECLGLCEVDTWIGNKDPSNSADIKISALVPEGFRLKTLELEDDITTSFDVVNKSDIKKSAKYKTLPNGTIEIITPEEYGTYSSSRTEHGYRLIPTTGKKSNDYVTIPPKTEAHFKMELIRPVEIKMSLNSSIQSKKEFNISIETRAGKTFELDPAFNSGGWSNYKNVTIITGVQAALQKSTYYVNVTNIEPLVTNCNDLRWVNDTGWEVAFWNMTSCNIGTNKSITFKVEGGEISASSAVNYTMFWNNGVAGADANTNNRSRVYWAYDGFEYAGQNGTDIQSVTGSNWTCEGETAYPQIGETNSTTAGWMSGNYMLVVRGNTNFGSCYRGSSYSTSGQIDNVTLSVVSVQMNYVNWLGFLVRTRGTNTGQNGRWLSPDGWNMMDAEQTPYAGRVFASGTAPAGGQFKGENWTFSALGSNYDLGTDNGTAHGTNDTRAGAVGLQLMNGQVAFWDEFTAERNYTTMPTATIGRTMTLLTNTILAEKFDRTPITTLFFNNTVNFSTQMSHSGLSSFWVSINLTSQNGSIIQLNRTQITSNGSVNASYTFNNYPLTFGNWTAQAYGENSTDLIKAELNLTFEIRNLPPHYHYNVTPVSTGIVYGTSFFAHANITDEEGDKANLTITFTAPNGTAVYNATFTNNNATVNAITPNWTLNDNNQTYGLWNISYYAMDNSTSNINVTSISFTINNTAPTTPTMIRPSSNQTVVATNYTVICGGSTDAEGDPVYYEIYGDTSNPATTLLSNLTGNSSNYAQGNLTGMNATTYNLRCRAGDGYNGVSAYTAPLSIAVTSFFGGTACNASNSTQDLVMNFTYANENNNSKLWNMDFGGTFFVWSSDKNINTTVLIDQPVTNETHLCLSPPNSVAYIDSEIQYTGSGFDPKEYYHLNSTINNVTQNTTLYSLDITLATGITFTVEDAKANPYEKVNIQTLRFDAGTNAYRLVAMGRTNDIGQDLMFLRKNDVLYKFIVYNYTTLLFTSKDTKLTASDNTYTITINPGTLGQIIDTFGGIKANLSYNATSGQFVLVYVDPSGTSSSNCLNVLRRTIYGDTNVSRTCQTTASGTITSTVGNTSGTYVAQYTSSINPSNPIISLIYEIGTNIANSIGKEGTVIAVMVFLTLTLSMIWNPVAAIVMGIIGLFVVSLLGLVHISYISIVTLIIMAAILIWKMRS